MTMSKQRKIVLLGDSIARGIVWSGDRYAISKDGVADLCAESMPIELQNYSKMGSTIQKGMQILEQRKDAIANSDYTILEFGGNDSDFYWNEIAQRPNEEHGPRTPIQDFLDMYRQMIRRVRELGSRPIMISLPLMDGAKFINFQTRLMSDEHRANVYRWLGNIERVRNYHDMYNLELFRLASEEKVPLLDITTPFLQCPDYTANLCIDGIHPNEQGHRMMADRIVKLLRPKK